MKPDKDYQAAVRAHAAALAASEELPGQGLKQTDIIAFNHLSEKRAIAYLRTYVHRHPKTTVSEACNLLAMELDISIETAKRYIKKHAANHPKAEMKISDGWIKFK